MKAVTKTVLFGRVTVDKHVHLWPIGVFANDKSAKAFAGLLKMAHDTGNAELAKSLDDQTRTAEDGTLITGFRMSIKIVAYEPTLAASGDAAAVEDSSSML